MFRAVAASLPAARRWLRNRLRSADLTAADVERLELMTSEAATNAVQHGAGDHFTITVDVGDSVTVAVHDNAPGRPALRRAGSWDTGGRGLMLIDTLADAWGVASREHGKWVWFRVDRRVESYA